MVFEDHDQIAEEHKEGSDDAEYEDSDDEDYDDSNDKYSE